MFQIALCCTVNHCGAEAAVMPQSQRREVFKMSDFPSNGVGWTMCLQKWSFLSAVEAPRLF